MKANEILLTHIQNILSSKPYPLLLVKDKVNYRRAHVVRLTLLGLRQKEIAKQIGCSISTIEKDFHALREVEYIK